ncbi:hypothetical protein KL86PLE_100613 [uncultured Pleomorphomonas sp.]|uniref:Uncharacterized protein n=1 Tax=uncultured Pleomorphomonas sp. TaxID=442121 RepID=A0A212L5B7_9HYPH|nr:hypothetical protein KL86PLE_100613 [uncultured Pleomorphomonas sp.]
MGDFNSLSRGLRKFRKRTKPKALALLH